jgi:hypothetical protein
MGVKKFENLGKAKPNTRKYNGETLLLSRIRQYA